MESREIKFTPLLEKNGSLYVRKTRPFKPLLTVNEFIPQVIGWAFAENQYFKEDGRDKKTILKNATLGKFGEFALYKFFKDKGYNPSEPELLVRNKGEWDEGDLFIDSKKIQVKTTSFKSDLLLLSKRDWDSNGNYLFRKSESENPYSAFFLCRMKPILTDVLVFENESDFNPDRIIKNLLSVNFRFDIPGFINIHDFRDIISIDQSIPSGGRINGSVHTIKNACYYCQSGDLREIRDLPKKK